MKNFRQRAAVVLYVALTAAVLLTGVGAESGWAKKCICENDLKQVRHMFIDHQGKPVITVPKRANYSAFSDGVALIRNDKSQTYALVDKSGTVLTLPEPIVAYPFSEKLAVSGDSPCVGFVNEKGELVIPARLDDAAGFHEGLAPVAVNQKCGFINREGKIVIDPFFDRVGHFCEGLAAAEAQGKVGFIDKNGKWVIKPQYSFAYGFSDGLALVSTDESDLSFVDKDGKKIIELDPKKITTTEHGGDDLGGYGLSPKRLSAGRGDMCGSGYMLCTELRRAQITSSLFHGGLAAVARDNKFGYIDKTGKFVIDPQFEEAYPFSEDLAVVKKDGKFGFVDRTGKLVVPPKYDSALPFKEGLAPVAVDTYKWGYIDKTGKYVVKPKYLFAHSFCEGLALVGY